MNRYHRQMLFPQIGEAGQQALTKSSVLVVGAGALGTVICDQLVRAGIGYIRMIDRDYVELHNLQRQTLFDEDDVAATMPKAVAAKQKLEKANSGVHIEAITGNVSKENIDQLLQDIDIVLDGTDNFATRFLLNDACFKYNIPYSYGGVVSSRGMTAFFIPGETPCLRCLMKEGGANGQTCDTVGVLAPAVNMIASFQVMETLKFLTCNKESLRNSLHVLDIWKNQQYDVKFSEQSASCPTCVQRRYPALQASAADEETVLCGRNTVQIHRKQKMDLSEWEQRLSNVATVKKNSLFY
ncbi:ThiF family adenylyltransferase [Virgibacillus halophilus]|uniref:ThiF family adenylyltransferase n=1 Tax=Tigheibacillus halophilus TaxID=361280 RepID=A0ABU5CBI7_9BACI|nr:ThiF family adenylyltransferase [Virgibacillus halophilus]